MKKIKKAIALTAMMAMLASPAYSQETPSESAAYFESSEASKMSLLLPVGALVVAGVIIATTNRGHHGSSSSSSSDASSSHSHSHSN
jgi:hypothetical protein